MSENRYTNDVGGNVEYSECARKLRSDGEICLRRFGERLDGLLQIVPSDLRMLL